MTQRRGLALLVVVAVLGILAVLAAAFVTMAQLERRASMQRLYATKALLLARSGIEDALARLHSGQDPDLPGSRYGGEDWDADGALSAFEGQQEVIKPGTLNRMDCPLKQALRPSFHVDDGTGKPRYQGVDGRQRGYSGQLQGDTESSGNLYTLKVMPEAGFYINEGAGDIFSTHTPVLRRMLGILAQALDREADGVPGNGPVTQADGFSLIDIRPPVPEGWTSWDQVRDVALGGSQVKLDALRPYLTLSAWVDQKVIRPNVPATMVGTLYTSWADIRMAPGAVPGFEARAPVNLAWARTRRPALLALLAGIKGYYLDEFVDTAMRDPASQGFVREAPILNTWSAGDDAHLIADQILATTSDLSTWTAWNAFCDGLNVTNTGYGGSANMRKFANFRQAKRDVLKAAFNPNSDLNKFNPNRTLWRLVDKQDLAVYSTEFSLEPLHGFDLECAGRVLGPGGRLAALRTVKAVVGGPGVLRFTTQRDFMAGDMGQIRLPGQAGFLSKSQGAGKTWGHKLPGLGNGIALQAYPEPCFDAGAGLAVSAADYDGNLQLATVETLDDTTYTVGSAPDNMKCLARFDTDFNLDVHDGPAKNLGDTQLVTAGELGNGLLHPAKPVTLHPDGVFSEKERAPAYLSLGNAHGFHGLASFWVKAQYTETDMNTSGPGGRGRYFFQWVNVSNTHNNDFNQSLIAGHSSDYMPAWGSIDPPGPDWDMWGFLFETGHQGDDTYVEHAWGTLDLPFSHHRWQLMTFCWDLLNGDVHRCGEFVLNGGGAPGEDCPFNRYCLDYNDVTMSSDLTDKDATGPNRFCLGGRELPNYSGVVPACATIDEFALWDFGPQDDGITKTLASERFKDGRYYKGDIYNPPGAPNVANGAGTWISAPITLPEASSLQRIAWTWLRPSELPDDYPEVELLDATGYALLWGAAKSRSSLGTGWSPDRQDWDVGGKPAGSFRLRVVFRRRTPLDQNAPILDSPVLDDLTLVHTPAAGLPIRGWEQP